MKYFSIKEFENSSTARAKGIDNTIKDVHIKNNIEELVSKVLDPLREKYGKPITISSGYRGEALNKAVGGSKTSQHCSGKAADLVISNKGIISTESNRKLYELIIKLGLPFDQLILEKGTIQRPQWIHISYDKDRLRKEILYTAGKGYIKIPFDKALTY